MTGPILSHDEVERHYEWRKRVSVHFPALSARVFALREKFYMGCGFHWGMERRLGVLIARVLNYDAPITFSDPTIEKLTFELLLRDLVRAEFSAKGIEFPRK